MGGVLTDGDVADLVPHVEFFLEQVVARDRDGIDAVLAGVAGTFHCDGGRAVAVVLADLLIQEREYAKTREQKFTQCAMERDKFATQYLAARRKVVELREIMLKKTAEVPTGAPARKVG